MELSVKVDDAGNEFVDRLDFMNSVVTSIKDYLGDNKITVRKSPPMLFRWIILRKVKKHLRILSCPSVMRWILN